MVNFLLALIKIILGIAKPYIALGGIQIRGGSERVRVLETHVVGGAGNGVTLGAASVAPQSATIIAGRAP